MEQAYVIKNLIQEKKLSLKNSKSRSEMKM